MDIGQRITILRKQHNWSQAQLAKTIGASRTIVGNYERNSNMPSLDMIVKMAEAFGVSVDFLVGKGQIANYSKDILNRMEDIQNLDDNTKDKLFFLIDNIIQNFKTKKAFA